MRKASFVPENHESEFKIMSARIYIYLFDQQACENTVLPAYRRFIHTSNTDLLIQLLQDGLTIVNTTQPGHGISFDPREVYEEAIDILAGKKYYRSELSQPDKNGVTTAADMRFFIQNFVGPSLIQIFCLPHAEAMSPRQNMSGNLLMGYLYSKSKWIEDYFTFAKEVSGQIPEIKLGEWSRFFSEEELRLFDLELSKMEKPKDGDLRIEFDRLCNLVHLAAADSKFRLLISIA